MINFYTQTLTALAEGDSPGVDELGIPIPGAELAIDIAAWYNPAANADLLQAGADQSVVGYTVVCPNTEDIRDILDSASERLLLDFHGVYKIIGRYQFVPDGFTIPGYIQFVVERVEG